MPEACQVDICQAVITFARSQGVDIVLWGYSDSADLRAGRKTTSATAMKKKHDSEHSAEWRNWYVLVLAVLLAQILFFTWFTAYFS